MRAWQPALAAALVLSVISCSDTAEDRGPAAGAELVVAQISSGAIRVRDLDRLILEGSAGFDPKGDRAEQLSAIARRVAVNRILLDEAILVGADQHADFRRIERRLSRNRLSNDYLSILEPPEPPTEAQLRESYQERLAEYQREEQRLVLHIYKRFASPGGREATLGLLATLRERLLAGETFEQLAREYSDSETRFEGGLLGLVAQGQFTSDFDRVVFSLDERTPSEPLVSGDGAHLFLVREVLEARDLSFEEVALSLRQELASVRRSDALMDAAKSLEQPQDVFLPDQAQLQQIVRQGEPGTPVLRVGDFTLNTAQFLELFEMERRLLGPRVEAELGSKLLNRIYSREVIYQYLRAQGLGATPSPEFLAERSAELIKFLAERKMRTWGERQSDLVQRHYDNNRMRFAGPLRFRLELLSIPVGETGTRIAAEIEAIRADLDEGLKTLEELAERYSGAVQDLGFVTSGQVQMMAPRAMRLLATLEKNQHTPPFTRGGNLRVFKMMERQDPTARPLALVRDEVVEDYLTHHAAEVFETLSDTLLEQAEYRLFLDRLDRVRLGQPE